uniref:Monoglyceride lipase n=1 Tax=Astyanax mexicanus TaxID=7994 RepID=A0A8B9KJN7_ASTMX
MPEEEAGGGSWSPQGVPYRDLPHIVSADGLHLFCRYWEPEAPPRALVFIAHGAGEHCGMYTDVAHTLVQKGLYVFAHDHGEKYSEKKRVDQEKHRGGAISILAACERPQDFVGVVLIGPLIQMNPESATPFKVFLAKVLSHMIPSLTLGAIDPKSVSRDPKQVEAYEADELNYHGGMRVSFGMQLMTAANRIERELPNITWPFYILHGDADKLCDIGGSHLMFNQAKSTDKKLKVYEGAYHALHHDLPETAESVLQEVSSWIVERLPAPSGP